MLISDSGPEPGQYRSVHRLGGAQYLFCGSHNGAYYCEEGEHHGGVVGESET